MVPLIGEALMTGAGTLKDMFASELVESVESPRGRAEIKF
jgi:hypothetical protein